MTGRQFRVDRGGTFTAAVAPRPDGRPLPTLSVIFGDIETPGGGGYGPPPCDNHPAGEETDDPRAH